MIGQITGKTTYKGERYTIITAGGVGYKLFVTPETLKTLDANAEHLFWTYLAVRENALDLYGFLEKRELEFFELLLSVSGIGPKSAQAIISIAPPDILTKAIAGGDSSYLTKVSGIGKKSAEKIIIELRDKIGSLDVDGNSLKGESDAIEALQSLGYTLREAREALQRVDASVTDTGAKVKAALKFLGR
jgi:Holliday junction DNA helicase RuvA